MKLGGKSSWTVVEGLDCTELVVGDDTVESLFVRLKGQANKGDVTMGLSYRPPRQDDDTDKLFFKDLRDTSTSAALVLIWDSSLPDVD